MHFGQLGCPLCAGCKYERKSQHFTVYIVTELQNLDVYPQMLIPLIQSQLMRKSCCHYVLYQSHQTHLS